MNWADTAAVTAALSLAWIAGSPPVHAGVLARSRHAPQSTASAPAEPPPAPAASTGPAANPDATSKPEPATALADGPAVLTGVLPCGLRVVVGRDTSLPVAAVVLAVETGTEDDPNTQPGLVHALAYHLLQGNRELAPGAAAAIVHDSGGFASLAVGPAQVRYESLVPISRLSETLWAESQRLRAPTVSEVLWTATIRWARRNKARAWSVPMAAVAAAHEVPALDHLGHRAGPEISEMTPRAIGAALAERFTYARATLTVVGPEAVDKTWTQVADAFATLPEATRALPKRLTTAPRVDTSATAPRKVPVRNVKGTRVVWPLPPDPGAYLHARVWCKALNRQRRVPAEGKRARVRCRMERDPRRGVVIVRGSGVPDPVALIAGRLARLADGSDAELVERQRRIVLAEDQVQLRTPLALARRLSQTVAWGQSPQRQSIPLADAVGHTPVLPGATATFPQSLSLPRAVQMVLDDSPPDAKDAPNTKPDGADAARTGPLQMSKPIPTAGGTP